MDYYSGVPIKGVGQISILIVGINGVGYIYIVPIAFIQSAWQAA